MAFDANGNLFVSDLAENTIRMISADGVVSTVAGTGLIGDDDGPGPSASFDRPTGLAFDTAGGLLVADSHNNSVRVLDPEGSVSPPGGCSAELRRPG